MGQSTLSPDRVVPVDTIETRPIGTFQRVCGRCGAVIASGAVDLHIAWHAAGAWTARTITTPTMDPAQK